MRAEVRFSFFAALGFLICTDREGTLFMCLAACTLHELGHLAVMLAEGKPPSSVLFYGGGIHIRGGSTSLAAVSAGCAVNLLLFVLFWFFPANGTGLKLFAVIDLLTAVFNLIPVGQLDGKAILEKISVKLLSPEAAMRLCDICEKTAAALMVPAAVVLVFTGYLNISALVFFFYLFASELIERS